jgi:hypothetical protein
MVLMLVLLLNVWFYTTFLPPAFSDAIQMMRERQGIPPAPPTVEQYEEMGYDAYEHEGDYPELYTTEHETPEDADEGMPGPMLECEAGDHTCID